MKDFHGRIAVVTGAASGIGRELALSCARAGMSVVLADVDEEGTAATGELLAPLLAPSGAAALSVRCDVSKDEQVRELSERAFERFGAVHLLFNNAGVGVLGPAWTTTAEDWQWVLGINVMGVVHGIRHFVPRMIAQNGEGHVVNTASVAGLVSVPGSSVYCVSKHAVVTLSECLHHDLRVAGSTLGVSVLCPAYVNTGIADSDRNRPQELRATNPHASEYDIILRRALLAGKLTAADVAAVTLEAIAQERFYVLPHGKIKAAIETRMRDILDDRNPTNTVPVGAKGEPR
ncbi:SDR family NAD(P)-dependent oxidoreductase [Pendulispora albinea]|uniref:SDR family NAD(P)-dependent oxidoreductase n=1 Tax=Pendulispora albinea TaxID=2741071 RepID=A0ABZ2M7V5_9BACT